MKKTIHLILNDSRGFGGYEELTSLHDFEVWKRIAVEYATFSSADDAVQQACFTVNWKPVVNYKEKLCNLYNATPKYSNADIAAFEFEQAHACNVEIVETKERVSAFVFDYPLLRTLHEIFLISNLASPGAFNLYRSYLRDPALDPAKNPLAQTELGLSEYLFENAWHEARDAPWLKIDFIAFDQVRNWYLSLGIKSKNVSSSPVERALLALLHLSKIEFSEQTATLWIASALESLFDTPSGGAFSFLCARVASLLDLNAAETSDLRKKLRSFFDIRHAFVHGGSDIWHPVVVYDNDKKAQQVMSTLISHNGFACSVLIACLQELVRRNWKGMRFDEQIRPL
ncbi:MAG: hypothetical protein ACRCWJ_10845 [Casimicrobium sp.]